MRHLFRLINFKTCLFVFLMQLFHDWLTSLPLLSCLPSSPPHHPGEGAGYPGGWPGWHLQPDTPRQMTGRYVADCHRTVTFSVSCQLNCHIRDYLGSAHSSSVPSKDMPLTALWSHPQTPEGSMWKVTTHSSRQSCLGFELLEMNPPWVSCFPTSCKWGRDCSLFQTPFPRMLVQWAALGTEMGSPCGGKGQRVCSLAQSGHKGQAGLPPSIID